MDYKNTLNLPKTSFPMKGNLPQTEPGTIAHWEEEKLYEQILSRRKGSAPFVLHDGPPYANGDIHIGHALNKVLKDFIVRYKNMRGLWAPYVPGWDCHGLPIEYALMKELKVTKHQVNIVDFRRTAREYARKYVGIQRNQFKRLGISGDWDHPYLTLEPEFIGAALHTLATLVEKGFIYRARKPVNWCWSCETALAEAEVEYEMDTSESIYAKFALTEDSIRSLLSNVRPELVEGRASTGSARTAINLVIWTTTPWTLMGNVAVAAHPDFEYAVYQVNPNEQWIVLSNLPSAAVELLGLNKAPIVKTMKGKELQDLKYRHPFGLREGKVVLANYVSTEEGTGLVHTAPGFGAEDYVTGTKYGLEILAPVDSRGQFVGLPKEVAQLNGQQVQKANPAVIELLKQRNLLVKEKPIEHQYPHCWRCRNPIIFRATDQWFFKVDHENLRQKLLEVIENQIQWIPPVGRERMASMIKTRPDWCLSRQRLWGIPIPAVMCTTCGEGILDPRVIRNFAAAAEAQPDGSDKWFSEEVTAWLPAGFTCPCGGQNFKAGTDILDVWFDSGVSHQGVLARREGFRVPAQMYLEGSDQHRGWFQVSLITGVALSGSAPYESVLTHGFVVDGEGRKMSKSVGNVIAPSEVISSLGADVLRLWVASADYAEDVRLSKEILSQTAEIYRKIRNTVRFCLANISDFDPKNMVSTDHMQELDQWMLARLRQLSAEVTESYEQYAFHKVVKAVHEFCTVRLSNFYLDVIKDPLYTSHPADPRRLSIQTVLWQIADVLIRVMAPILPLTMEEAWKALSPQAGDSLHLQGWVATASGPTDQPLDETWRRLLQLRDEVMKALEKARAAQLIGDALEAELVVIVRDESLWKFLELRKEQLATACIVSVLQVKRGEGPGDPVEFQVNRSAGSKCQRCWMRLPTVGQSSQFPDLCFRCVGVVSRLNAQVS